MSDRDVILPDNAILEKSWNELQTFSFWSILIQRSRLEAITSTKTLFVSSALRESWCWTPDMSSFHPAVPTHSESMESLSIGVISRMNNSLNKWFNSCQLSIWFKTNEQNPVAISISYDHKAVRINWCHSQIQLRVMRGSHWSIQNHQWIDYFVEFQLIELMKVKRTIFVSIVNSNVMDESDLYYENPG
jgi:hypothetical protein